MTELTKLKINLSCLIRLTKTELYDSIEDLNKNIEMINYYESKNTTEYEAYIHQLKFLNSVYINSTIELNNKLKHYYKDLKEFDITFESNDVLDEINRLQSNLEKSISNLEKNRLEVKEYNGLIKDKTIVITSSETNYLTSEVLRNYDNLKQAKLKYYNNHINILIKKYN